MSRRTVVLLAVMAVVVVLLYGGAVAAGSRQQGDSSAATDTWSARLAGGGSEVAEASLDLPPPCRQVGAAVSFTGTCTVGVPAAGGLPLSGLSRRLTLQTVAGPVHLSSTVRGHDASGDLPAEPPSRLGFGRDPVSVALTCQALHTCTVRLGG